MVVGSRENEPPWAAVVDCDNINIFQLRELCDAHIVCIHF